MSRASPTERTPTSCAFPPSSLASTLEAGSTIFERSYYSHAPAKPVEVGPQAHRAPVGPVFSRPQGFAVNNGYRLQRSFIRVGGQIVDQTYNWDSWVQRTNKW